MNPLRVLSSYLAARRRQTAFADRAHLETWQDRRVRAHLAFVRRASPYFGRLFAGLDNCNWRGFPVSDKRALVEHFDTLNTRGLCAGDIDPIARAAERSRDFSARVRGLTIGMSSGTSGRRALFVSSRAENDFWLGVILARAMREPLWRPQRIALFHRAHSTLYANAHVGPITLGFFDLLREPAALVEDCRRFDPTILVGPPAFLRLLADARCGLRPRQVVSVAEVLDPLDRAAIEAGFSRRVEELYIATEGFLAFTCPAGSLHLNEDFVAVQKQPLDGDAERFTPVLTDFVRRVQPIVRHRLDDVLIEEPGACACGSIFRRLRRIEGRCDDVLVFEPLDAERPPVRVFPDFIRAAVTADARVEAFAVCQVEDGALRVQLRVEDAARTEAERIVALALERLLQGCGAGVPRVEFCDYEPVRGQRKLRRVERRSAPAMTQGAP